MTELQATTNSTPVPVSDGQQMWLHAETLAKSDLVPDIYRGKPANVFLAMDIAQRMQVGIFEVMQNLDLIKGKPGFSAKYKIGLANQRGPFKGPIRFDTAGEGKTLAVTAWAIDRETDARCERTVTWAMAEGEGWTKNAKYRTIPEQMFTYRSASFLINAYCPEVTLGFPTTDEIEDVRYAESEVMPPKAQEVTAALNAILAPEEEKPEVPVEEPAPEEPDQASIDAFTFDDEEMA